MTLGDKEQIHKRKKAIITNQVTKVTPPPIELWPWILAKGSLFKAQHTALLSIIYPLTVAIVNSANQS